MQEITHGYGHDYRSQGCAATPKTKWPGQGTIAGLAPVAQWIEYCSPKAGVAGSIPAGRTIFPRYLVISRYISLYCPPDFCWPHDAGVSRRYCGDPFPAQFASGKHFSPPPKFYFLACSDLVFSLGHVRCGLSSPFHGVRRRAFSMSPHNACVASIIRGPGRFMRSGFTANRLPSAAAVKPGA